MKDSNNVIQDLLHRYVRILPSKNNTRCHILQDRRCHLAGWFVEDVGEVVLREQRVGWVRTVRVCPRFVLMFTTCVNDTATPRFELCRDCIDDWADVRCKE